MPFETLNQLDSQSGSFTIDYTVTQNKYIFAKLEFNDLTSDVAITSPIFIDPPQAQAKKSVDAALVIDCSGSMDWNDPDNLRIQSAKQFIDLAAEGDKIAVIGFTYDAYIFAALQEINGQEDRDNLKQAVDQVTSSGGTDIGEGILVGKEELNTDTIAEISKAIILLTDGESSYQDEHLQCTESGIRIYTVGLGDGIDTELLQRIADETRGRYYAVSNADALQSIYMELSEDISGGSQQIVYETEAMQQGDEVQYSVNVEPNTIYSRFNILWSGSDFDLTLIRPDGRILNPDSPEHDFSYVKGPTYVSYTVDWPLFGEWEYIITANEVPAEGESVQLSLNTSEISNPEVTIQAFEDGSILDAPVTVTGHAEDSDGLIEASIFLDGSIVETYELSDETEIDITYILNPNEIEDGRHSIMYWFNDSNYGSKCIEKEFIIDIQTPIADAGPDQTVTVGEIVWFDAINSQDLDHCTWNFGDGIEVEGYYSIGAFIYENPGVYPVTLTVYDPAGNSATDEVIVTVVPDIPQNPQLYKTHALTQLQSIQMDDPQVETLISLAEGYISLSLNESFWLDDVHLNQTSGYSVFVNEQMAAETLLTAINETENHELQSVLSSTLDYLIMADEMLVSTALDEVQQNPPTNMFKLMMYNIYIDRAEEEMEEASLAIENGDMDDAIDHFGQAWLMIQMAADFC